MAAAAQALVSRCNGQRTRSGLGRAAALGRGNGARVTMSAEPPKKVDKWAALDPRNDPSDDQQDITRGKGMVDSLFQGWKGQGSTQARGAPARAARPPAARHGCRPARGPRRARIAAAGCR